MYTYAYAFAYTYTRIHTWCVSKGLDHCLGSDKLPKSHLCNPQSIALHHPQHLQTESQQLNGYPQGIANAPCLILDGASLDLCVEHHESLFLEVACAAPTVVVCRCSPTQKASTPHQTDESVPSSSSSCKGILASMYKTPVTACLQL